MEIIPLVSSQDLRTACSTQIFEVLVYSGVGAGDREPSGWQPGRRPTDRPATPPEDSKEALREHPTASPANPADGSGSSLFISAFIMLLGATDPWVSH
jgi:hypothetical protein